MRYHVVLKDEVIDEKRWTFDNWLDAEIEARFICHQHDDWVPDRYPGRSSRTGEVAVFLDRRVLDRQAPYRELAIIRANPQRPAPARKVAPVGCKSAQGARPAARVRGRRRAAMTKLYVVRRNRLTGHASA
jgi:hypothetical protein